MLQLISEWHIIPNRAQEAEDTDKEKMARDARLAKKQAAKDLTTIKVLTLTLHMYIKATIVTII